MSRLSMDLKVMPRSHKGHKYILCVIDEVTNFLVMVPIFQARSEEIGETLLVLRVPVLYISIGPCNLSPIA